MIDKLYDKLSESEKQICDLCKDWNLCHCDICSIYLNNCTEGCDKDLRSLP